VMPLTVGSRLGPYDILSPLGAGGFGEVYKARDTRLDRLVAIKIVSEALGISPEFRDRFEREARILAALNHPAIAHVHGLEQAGSSAFLVMELAVGETLAALVARGRIALDEALDIARQIIDALEAAHEKGIVHRDLKPANIVVSPDGKVKVLDFGLAKLAHPDSAFRGQTDLSMSPTMAQGTMAGVILGTAAYMSPEQARGKPVDKRTDIWAFGCVLFEMLTGTQAFPGDTLTDVVAAVVTHDPDWQRLPADTPPAVRAVLRRCLTKDPARRLHDVVDARLELDDPPPADAALRPQPTSRPLQRWMRVAPWVVAVVSMIVAATLALGSRPAGEALATIARLEVSPPSGVELYSGGGRTISLSPDGRTIAFVGVRGGVRQVYLRRLDEFEASPLRGTDGAFSCFFSPAGDAIGFVSTNGSLRRVSIADGLVVTLAPLGADNTGSQAWGPDNRITFNRAGVLWQIPASGGNVTQLTRLDAGSGELAHEFPAPVDRTSLLFTALSANGAATSFGSTRPARIEAITPATGARHVVIESAMFPMLAAGHLVFFRDDALFAVPFDARTLSVSGTPVRVVEHIGIGSVGAPIAALAQAGSLVYATSTTATSTLAWVSRRGAQEPVTDVPRQYAGPRVSPDGRRIVVQASGDLWIHDIERATFTRLTTTSTFGNSFPVWAPDGNRIVFRTSTGIHVIDVDRSVTTARRIPDTTSGDFPTSVSPDGETLLVVRQTSTMSQDVYVMPMSGKGPQRPLISTPAFEGGAMFSPDGRWIAYVSDESGQMQVYVRPTAKERRWPVSIEGGTSPVWNRNGRELFFRNGNKIMAVEVAATGAELTLSPPRLLFEHAYTYGATITIPNYDVSPDGQRFVMVQDDPGAGRLAIALNWSEELKRLLPTR